MYRTGNGSGNGSDHRKARAAINFLFGQSTLLDSKPAVYSEE
jgi:hypothetical protein